MEPDGCPICIDPLSDMTMIQLECHHRIHLHCMRKLLKYQNDTPRNDNEEEGPQFHCPLCRGEVSPDMQDNINSESRNLCFKYLLSRSLSESPDSTVRVVVKVGTRFVKSEKLKVRDLPTHSQFSNRAYLVVDLELRVQDPKRTFPVWVENVETRERISTYYYVGTNAIDHHSSGEEEAEELMIGSEPPRSNDIGPVRQPNLAAADNRRRRRTNPVTDRERQMRRLERRAIARSAEMTRAKRAFERSHETMGRRHDQLQIAFDRCNEAMNALIEYRFGNVNF